MGIVLHGTPTTQRATSATSLTVTLPSGISNGDLIAVGFSYNGPSSTIGAPAGWTVVANTQVSSASAITGAFLWKIWHTGDPTTAAITQSGSAATLQAVCAAYSGVNQTSPIDASLGQANTNSTTGTSPSITVPAGHNADQLLMFYSIPGSGHAATSPSLGTVRADLTTGPEICLVDALLSASGATGNQTVSLGGSSARNIGIQVALLPAVVPSPAPTVRPSVQPMDWRALQIYAQASGVLSSPPAVPATVPFFAGFETGDFSEFSGTVGTTAIDSTITVGGSYSARMPWSGTNNIFFGFPLQLTTAYLRSTIYTTAAGGAAEGFLLGFNSAGGTPVVYAHLVTDGLGGVKLRLWNHITGTQVGSDFSITPATWYTVEVKLVVSATVGIAELRVNGAVVATGSGLNTANNPVTTANFSSQIISGVATSGNVWHDNVQLNTKQYPGFGYVIARQIAANGTYSQWTLSSGTQLAPLLDKTPVTATGNVNTATAGNRFSGVVDFTTGGGTGSTGFGTGVVGSNDTVNAFKIGAFGQTNSFASDGADSTIFHSGGDIITPIGAGWTTNAAPGTYQETYLANVPLTSQVRNLEVGIQKGSGPNLHVIYAIWAMVDYTPSTTGPTLPLVFQTSPLQWNAVQTYAALGRSAYDSSAQVQITGGTTPPPYPSQQAWNAIRIYAEAGRNAYDSSPPIFIGGQESVQPYLTQQQWNAINVIAQAGNGAWNSGPLVDVPGHHGAPVVPPTQRVEWNAVKAYAQATRGSETTHAQPAPAVVTDIQFTFMPLSAGIVPGARIVVPQFQQPQTKTQWDAVKVYAQAGASGFNSSPLVDVPGQHHQPPVPPLQRVDWNALKVVAQAGNGAQSGSPLVDVPGQHWLPPQPPLQRVDWNALRGYAQAGASGFSSSPLVAVPGDQGHPAVPPRQRVDWNAVAIYAQAGRSAYDSSAMVAVPGQQSVQGYRQQQQWDALRGYAQAGRSAFDSSPLIAIGGQQSIQPYPTQVRWDGLRAYAEAGRNAYDSSPFIPPSTPAVQSQRQPVQYVAWNALAIYAEAGRSGAFGPPVVPPPPFKHLHFNGPWVVQNLTIRVLQVSAATSLL